MSREVRPSGGQRVLLRKGHPHAGHAGEVVSIETVDGEKRTLRVRLDDGLECFAFPGDWQPI